MNRSLSLLLLIILLPSLGITYAKTRPTTAPSPTIIKIEKFACVPDHLDISAGSTVTWVNADDVPHTATGKGADPAFDSGPLDTDDKFSFKFTTPGTYEYYCKVHPHMTGTITVK